MFDRIRPKSNDTDLHAAPSATYCALLCTDRQRVTRLVVPPAAILAKRLRAAAASRHGFAVPPIIVERLSHSVFAVQLHRKNEL
jgi:hypothetical protein